MQSVKERVVSFFQENKDKLLSNWAANIHEEHSNQILQNGEIMLKLVLHYTFCSNDKDPIKKLAHAVAAERVEAGASVTQFLENVNLGRSEMFKHLYKLELEMHDLQEIINKLNECFDFFIVEAVSAYTDRKDKIIEEKNNFISETHQDRLTILGQMASSYVHECRNPLTSVMGFVQLLKKEYSDLPYLDIVDNELKQLEFRISQFLLLSKKELIGKAKEVFYISELVQEVIEFLYPSIVDHNILVQHQNVPIRFYGYKDEMKQVFVNIIFNSIDALMEREGERKITIQAHVENDSLSVAIINNGPKIPDKSLRTIFEPFVTTKQLGTGLGLFVCQEIINKHGGRIYCESHEMETTFTLYFEEFAMEQAEVHHSCMHVIAE